MSEIQNKVVIITGASSGLAAATAERLAASGAKLMLAARREDRLKELVAAILQGRGYANAKSGWTADYLVTDVSVGVANANDADAIARAIAYAIEQPTDVDVNEIIIRPTHQT